MSEISRQDKDEPVEQKEEIPISIRDVRLSDCDDMVAVWKSLIEEKAPVARQTIKTKEQQMSDLEKIQKGLEKKEVVYQVAEVNGHVVGWASISGVQDKETGRVGTLGVVLLEKVARGKGIAGNLLETTIDKAKEVLGINEVVLQTFAFNESAKKLYLNHGFQETGAKLPSQNYYGEKRERIEMSKRLTAD